MSSKKTYAPIILFTYRRHNTLKKVIKNLELNKLSKYSEIYIFSDGYKNFKDKKDVLKVRKFLKTIKFFKKKKIFLRNKNMGLTKNIILGITKVLSIKKKAIILEDDILVSENFLTFMNQSLDKYNKIKKIWHINSWNYNLKKINNKNDAFYWRGMHCWGWATWHDRWKAYEKKPEKLIKTFTHEDIFKINYDGCYNFWSQVQRNYTGTINTWAIFWYITIFRNNGLCVSPLISLSKNIGADEYATNYLKNNNSLNFTNSIKFFKKKSFKFQKKLTENSKIFYEIKKYLKSEKSIKSIYKYLNFSKLVKKININ